ncbi:MAG: hypothetical protein HOP12_07640 [Candidatus Eisenbacteria bacterium]|uniref:Lipoprotein n=1 Tax=Eiseniibacteriota bacterium TaxID=2212470 RepID=A0A849SHH9_UNCEI|nr:hypothetical protein [Candidatus Eisenbacteria bacterium]
MMLRTRRLGAPVLLVAALLGGCTSLREVPREQFAVSAERRDVQVLTLDSLRYEFDVVRFSADSLTGFRRREADAPIELYDWHALSFGDVQRISTRRTDWYRTGLFALGLAVGSVTYLLTQRSDEGPTGDGGPIKGPIGLEE